MESVTKEVVFIRINRKHLKIAIDDILYLKAAGSYLRLITLKDKYSLSQNLSQFMRKNNMPAMIRVHRSYVVNISKVHSFDKKNAYIGKRKIPIGGNFKEKFMSQIHCL